MGHIFSDPVFLNGKPEAHQKDIGTTGSDHANNPSVLLPLLLKISPVCTANDQSGILFLQIFRCTWSNTFLSSQQKHAVSPAGSLTEKRLPKRDPSHTFPQGRSLPLCRQEYPRSVSKHHRCRIEQLGIFGMLGASAEHESIWRVYPTCLSSPHRLPYRLRERQIVKRNSTNRDLQGFLHFLPKKQNSRASPKKGLTFSLSHDIIKYNVSWRFYAMMSAFPKIAEFSRAAQKGS